MDKRYKPTFVDMIAVFENLCKRIDKDVGYLYNSPSRSNLLLSLESTLIRFQAEVMEAQNILEEEKAHAEEEI